MELDQGTKWLKDKRVEVWEEAHRSTIGEFFERGYINVK
jgi:hypothetical protein